MKTGSTKTFRSIAALLVGIAVLAAVLAYFSAQALTPDMRLVFDPSLDPLWWVSAALLSVAAAVSAFALWRMLSWSSVAFGVFGACLVLVLLVVIPWHDLDRGGRLVWIIGIAAIVIGLGASLRFIRLNGRLKEDAF